MKKNLLAAGLFGVACVVSVLWAARARAPMPSAVAVAVEAPEGPGPSSAEPEPSAEPLLAGVRGEVVAGGVFAELEPEEGVEAFRPVALRMPAEVGIRLLFPDARPGTPVRVEGGAGALLEGERRERTLRVDASGEVAWRAWVAPGEGARIVVRAGRGRREIAFRAASP